MSYYWLFLPHAFRAVFGGVILLKGLPKSHEVIECIQIRDIENATLETVQDDFALGVLAYIAKKGHELKYVCMVYTLLTFLCYMFDCLNFLLQFKNFGQESHNKAETILLIAAILHWFLTIAFFAWIGRLKFRLPAKLQLGIQQLLFGWTDHVGKQTEDFIKRAKKRFPGRGGQPSEAAAAQQNNTVEPALNADVNADVRPDAFKIEE